MSMNQTELRYQLALSRAPKVGAITFRALLNHWQTAQAIFNASPSEWQQIGLSENLMAYLRKPPWHLINQDLAWQNQPMHHVMTLTDSRYPNLLKEINDAPPLLFLRGDPSLLDQPQIAIVGSRNPTPAGLEIATEIANQLSQLGFCITSGLALGIDAAAHRGALQNQGQTVAVLGCGLNRVYPHRHRQLANEIALSGALLSEFPPNTPPLAPHFPQRNRVISGLSLGTLVVEATPKSGSLITARLACAQNREVFAVPGSIHNPLAWGCHQLIQQGAKLVESVADIIAELTGWVSTLPAQPLQQIFPALDGDQQKLVECMSFETTSIDHLVIRSQFSAQRVASILSELELLGYIEAVPGGYMRIKK